MPDWFPLELVVKACYTLWPWAVVCLIGGWVAGTALLVAGFPRK